MENYLKSPRKLISNKVSDKIGIRAISGNSRELSRMKTHEDDPFIHPRPLVEEQNAITVENLKAALGRRELLRAIRDARPVRIVIEGQKVAVHLVWEAHRLPGRTTRWSDIDSGDVRLWLQCPTCRQKVWKLYLQTGALPSLDTASLGCRRCLGLRYMSQNSWNRKWWQTAKLIRRLLRQQKRLLERPTRTPKILTELEQIDLMLRRSQNKSPSHRRSRKQLNRRPPSKRPYRNLALVIRHG